MFRVRRAMGALAVLISALALMIVGGPVAGAQPLNAPAPPVVAPVQSVSRAYQPSPVRLPHHTYHRADGSVDVIADPEAVAKLQAAAAATSCGYACDGKDPNSYKFNGSTCNDALTIYTHDEGWAYAELRFSGRCATAWTRTCCYARAGGFGYTNTGAQRSSVYNYGGVNTGSPVWTAMLNDASSLSYKACFDRVVAGTPSDWACTSKF